MNKDVRRNTTSFNVRLKSASDSRAALEVVTADECPATNVSGTIYGPKCEYARTLAARYPLACGTALIPEPCYWTPQLPFLYDIAIRASSVSDIRVTPPIDSAQEVVQRKVGLRRLTIRQQSLYWESRRIVLRGACVKSLTMDLILEARSAEVALLTPTPSYIECDLTDRYGVPIIADLRASKPSIDDICALAHRPSVAMILVDVHDVMPCDFARFSHRPLVAVSHYPDDRSFSSTDIPQWSSAIAVELESKSRPPAWMVNCGVPVIAIRRGGAYADFQAAHDACDRLQAELAPEFDLAGYFV